MAFNQQNPHLVIHKLEIPKSWVIRKEVHLVEDSISTANQHSYNELMALMAVQYACINTTEVLIFHFLLSPGSGDRKSVCDLL